MQSNLQPAFQQSASRYEADPVKHFQQHQPPDESAVAAILAYAVRSRSCFHLAASDERALEHKRGVKRATQRKAGFISAPSEIHNLIACHEIYKRFGKRQYPAPFYWDDFAGLLRANIPQSGGIIVPCRIRGLQRAWLYYKHPSDLAPRWLTANGKPCGLKANPSIHIVGIRNAERSGIVVLVSDALEAERRAGDGAVCFVGLNGVAPSTLTTQLRVALPCLRAVLLDLGETDVWLTRALDFAGLRWEVA
jgi:hypothetical protein